MVVLDLPSNTYFHLNETGAHIWRCIAEGLSFTSIIDRVAAMYDISLDVATRDVMQFAQQLLDADLVNVMAPGPDGIAPAGVSGEAEPLRAPGQG